MAYKVIQLGNVVDEFKFANANSGPKRTIFEAFNFCIWWHRNAFNVLKWSVHYLE